jgi:hypothetical protein
MLEKRTCPDCEPSKEKSSKKRRAVLVRNACATCLGRGVIFSLRMDDIKMRGSYRCGELRLKRSRDRGLRGRLDGWHPNAWRHIECEGDLQDLLWSCAHILDTDSEQSG